MNGQASILSLYEKMKAKNIDMGWYERGKAKKVGLQSGADVPITDDQCGLNSLYLWKANGELWTFTIDKDVTIPYKKVRDQAGKVPGEDTFICMHCRTLYLTLKEAKKHYGKKPIK